MGVYCFTVDDNIRFLKELTQQGYTDLFDHPYLAMYRRLHQKFGVKVQLNLFYEMPEFDLTQMSERFKSQWEENANWLKLSFHSRLENIRPYEFSDYREVYEDAKAVNCEILRFAGPASLAETTTVHYCQANAQGLQALKDLEVRGLLGLFGSPENPRTSYEVPLDMAEHIRAGQIVSFRGVPMGSLDIVINDCKREDQVPALAKLLPRDQLHLMIHEQYFYSDYSRYLPDFEDMLFDIFAFMEVKGFIPQFFEEMIER